MGPGYATLNVGNTAPSSYYTTNAYSSTNSGSTWTLVTGYYGYMQLLGRMAGSIVWKAVAPSTAISKIAVVADETLNAGTITFYVSGDGTNWTQITSLNAMQALASSITSIYIKALITGAAVLNGIGWGC